jgi:hypothetical protein
MYFISFLVAVVKKMMRNEKNSVPKSFLETKENVSRSNLSCARTKNVSRSHLDDRRVEVTLGLAGDPLVRLTGGARMELKQELLTLPLQQHHALLQQQHVQRLQQQMVSNSIMHSSSNSTCSAYNSRWLATASCTPPRQQHV